MFSSDVFKEIKNEFDINKNSHSYMIYTNDFFSCKNDLNYLIKQIFNVDNLHLVESDYFVVEKSDRKNILKDEVERLKNFFRTTSYISKKRIYLIEEAHKLNSTSANMILKFLEEPYDNVIAFFITTNLDSVLNTIKSRCQIINVFYNNNEVISKENNIIEKILYDNNKYFSIIKAKKQFEKYDRNQLISIFDDFLNSCYSDINNSKKVELIKILNRVISMLNNNVNIDYVFDYLFLGSSDLNESDKC